VTAVANERAGTITIPESDFADLLRELERLQNEAGQPNQTPAPTPSPGSPNPTLISPQVVTIQAGETLEVELILRNIGMQTASEILTQASPASGSPFIVEFIEGTNRIPSLPQNQERRMTLRITAFEDAESGTHVVTLNHSFRNPARQNSYSASSFIVRVEGAGAAGVPNVRLGNFRFGGLGETTQPLSPGENFTVSANIENIGLTAAQDVQVSLQNMSADTIFFTGNLNQAFFANMSAGHSSTVNFNFQVSNNISTGTYPIEFQITFRDSNGESTTRSFEFFVNVYAPEDTSLANLEIRGLTAPTGQIGVGQTATISFYVYNTGTTEARNIRISASPESGVVPTTAGTQTIPSLGAGESHRLTFSFSPTNASETRSYSIQFTVTSQSAGETMEFEQFSAINVNNPTREDDTTEDHGRFQIPLVIVSQYVTTPLIPRAGQEFEMDITFLNTNSTRSINNIRIILEAIEAVEGQGTVFVPVGGSNTLFVDYLPPRGEVTKTLRFFTVMDAAPRSYTMRVNFSYQDEDFHTHDLTEQLSISVAQVTSLETTHITLPPMGDVGGMVPFEFWVINSGRVNLSSVRIRVEGPFDDTGSNNWIGNVDAQRMVGFEGRFTPTEPGEHTGRLVIYGEDATGAIVEHAHEFTMFVNDPFGGGGGRGDYFGEGGGWGMDDWGGGMDDGRDSMIWGDDWAWDGSDEGDSGEGGILNILRRPVVWSPIVAVLCVAVIGGIVVAKKRKSGSFDDDF